MTEREYLDRLDQRRRYLELRARIKHEMGWENRYEEEEGLALAWALAKLKAKSRVANVRTAPSSRSLDAVGTTGCKATVETQR